MCRRVPAGGPTTLGTGIKITEVRAHPISVALKEAFWTAAEPVTRHDLVIVEVRTDEGLAGHGQAYGSPLSLVAELVLRFGAVAGGMAPSRMTPSGNG